MNAEKSRSFLLFSKQEGSRALKPLTPRGTKEAARATCDPSPISALADAADGRAHTQRPGSDPDHQALPLQGTGPEDAVTMETAHTCPLPVISLRKCCPAWQKQRKAQGKCLDSAVPWRARTESEAGASGPQGGVHVVLSPGLRSGLGVPAPSSSPRPLCAHGLGRTPSSLAQGLYLSSLLFFCYFLWLFLFLFFWLLDLLLFGC